MRIMMFQINNQRAPLNDVNVRRAISYAFDYDGFNKEILGGSVERNPVPIPNNLWGVPKRREGLHATTSTRPSRSWRRPRPRSTGRSPSATSRGSARPSRRRR